MEQVTDVIDLCSSDSDDNDNGNDEQAYQEAKVPAVATHQSISSSTASSGGSAGILRDALNRSTVTGRTTGSSNSSNNDKTRPTNVAALSRLLNPYHHSGKRKATTGTVCSDALDVVCAPTVATADGRNQHKRSRSASLTNGNHDVHGEDVVFPHEHDRALVSSGIIPLLLKHYRDVLAEVYPMTSCISMLHVQQQDKWSCGYRNLQMLLSAILPDLSRGHSYFQHQRQQSRYLLLLPSLHEIQQSMEKLWSTGYDRTGAHHYNYILYQRPEWIGAVEVANYLSYHHIDTTVVEFILCRESRSLLLPFCLSYFTKRLNHLPTCPYSVDDGPATNVQAGSHTIARNILQQIEQECRSNVTTAYLNHNDLVIPTCTCPIPPLYLQWNGHSVTIIGIELSSNSLLVFDPKCNGSKIKDTFLPRQHSPDCTSTSNRRSGSIRRRTATVPSVLRLPISKVVHRDCQIVLVSTIHSLSPYEQDDIRRQNVPSITAANDAVRKIREQNNTVTSSEQW